jgi:MFS family permease
MGVGAFHPPAAAAVGRLAGPKRSRYIALFFLAGMLGGMAGNVFTPGIVEAAARTPTGIDPQRGLDFLRWFMIPGLVCAVLLHISIRSVGHRGSNSGAAHDSWDRAEVRARWGAVLILYVSNILRFTVNMALVYLFSEWAQRHTLDAAGVTSMTEALGAQASGLNGRLQGAMQVGMGTGGLLLGFVLSARYEKSVFWFIPTLGALAIAAISLADGLAIAVPLAMLGSVLAGAGFGACVPVSMSVAQRMLPHRTSLASGLMLGGAWAFAFVGPLTVEWVQNGLAGGLGLDAAFFVTAGALFVAGLITLALPRELMHRTHAD